MYHADDVDNGRKLGGDYNDGDGGGYCGRNGGGVGCDGDDDEDEEGCGDAAGDGDGDDDYGGGAGKVERPGAYAVFKTLIVFFTAVLLAAGGKPSTKFPSG